jgi:hypothetical protein
MQTRNENNCHIFAAVVLHGFHQIQQMYCHYLPGEGVVFGCNGAGTRLRLSRDWGELNPFKAYPALFVVPKCSQTPSKRPLDNLKYLFWPREQLLNPAYSRDYNVLYA